jgi:hypothetical protein
MKTGKKGLLENCYLHFSKENWEQQKNVQCFSIATAHKLSEHLHHAKAGAVVTTNLPGTFRISNS